MGARGSNNEGSKFTRGEDCHDWPPKFAKKKQGGNLNANNYDYLKTMFPRGPGWWFYYENLWKRVKTSPESDTHKNYPRFVIIPFCIIPEYESKILIFYCFTKFWCFKNDWNLSNSHTPKLEESKKMIIRISWGTPFCPLDVVHLGTAKIPRRKEKTIFSRPFPSIWQIYTQGRAV